MLESEMNSRQSLFLERVSVCFEGKVGWLKIMALGRLFSVVERKKDLICFN